MKKTILHTLILAGLAGCASTEVKEKVSADFVNSQKTVSKATASLKNRPIVLPELATPYYGNRSVAEAEFAEDLPRSLRSDKKAKFSAKSMTLEEFAKMLTEETGVATKVFADSTSNQISTNSGSKPTQKTIDISGLPAMPVKQLLETAMSQFGVDWDYYDGALHIETNFRKTYAISITPSKTTSSISLGKKSTSSQGASIGNTSMTGDFSSTLESKFDGDIDPVKDIQDTLAAMAGDPKKVFLNKSVGLATVTCSKDCHRQVKSFLTAANHLMSQQVLFQVDEITVSSTRTGSSGIDWNLVYQKLAKDGNTYTFGLGTPANLVQSAIAGNISSNIFSPVATGNSKFASSKMLIEALSSLSNVTDTKPYSFIAMNNEPATLTAVDQQSYVASSTVVPTGTLGTPVSSQTLGYATFGQLIQLTPTILPGGKIIVRFGLDDTKLKSLVPGEKQGDVDKLLLGGAKFTTKAILRAGSTLVLSGFKRTNSSVDNRGLFKNQSLGSESATTETSETIILITPYISGV